MSAGDQYGRTASDDPTGLLQAAALSALLTLSVYMTVASFAGIVPSPPHDKLPFVAANMALAVASLVLVRTRHRASAWVATLCALSYLPAVGPQKLLTEVHAAALSPVIAVGSLSVLAVLACVLAGALSRRPR